MALQWALRKKKKTRISRKQKGIIKRQGVASSGERCQEVMWAEDKESLLEIMMRVLATLERVVLMVCWVGKPQAPSEAAFPEGSFMWNTNEWDLQELCSTVATGNQIGKRSRRWGNGGSEYGQRHTTVGREEHALWSWVSQACARLVSPTEAFYPESLDPWKYRNYDMERIFVALSLPTQAPMGYVFLLHCLSPVPWMSFSGHFHLRPFLL